jgi:inner membrane protein
MPSPVGHAIAGATIAWLAKPDDGSTPAVDAHEAHDAHELRIMTATAAFLAAAPDLDLLFPWTHRTASHSVTAVGVVCLLTIIATRVTGQVTRWSAPRVVIVCTVAYASHLLLDWMAVDDTPPRGIQILWPFSQMWFISGWDLFRGTARLGVFTAAAMRQNLFALVQETLTLGPIAWLVWLVRVKPAARLASEVSGGDHPAQ